MDLEEVGELIAQRRGELKLRQEDLALRAGVGRSTLAALEKGRMPELGFSKVASLLSVLGLSLRAADANRGRPTLDELRSEGMSRARSLD